MAICAGRSLLVCAALYSIAATGCASVAEPVSTASSETMVVVPAGWFLRGQDDGPQSSRPQRWVYLDAFAIDRTEVTNAAFVEFVTTTGTQVRDLDLQATAERPNDPASGIIWKHADAFCQWAGKRLPTEAEWEKAARSADGRRYPWGDEWDPSRANTADGGPGDVMPVGSFPAGASPCGALDMAGNVAEWVTDYFDAAYYSYAPDYNPLGPTRVVDHVLRGGSWASPAAHALTFFRDSSHDVTPNSRVGFRCAMTVTETAESEDAGGK